MFFHLDTDGNLYSIKFEYNAVAMKKDKATAGWAGQATYHRRSKWTEITIFLPKQNPNANNNNNEVYEEELSHIHAEITEHYIVVMRRSGITFKISRDQLDQQQDIDKTKIQQQRVMLPIRAYYEEKSEVDEIGIKWMNVQDVIQFKLKQCLIHYDLNAEREIASLNNY